MEHFSNVLIISYDSEKRDNGQQSSALIVGMKEANKIENRYFEHLDIINNYTGYEADTLYEILIGCRNMHDFLIGGNKEMGEIITTTTLSPMMETKKNEEMFQYVKCCGCPFNKPYEQQIRGCGAETCFVDADYQITMSNKTEWNNDRDKGKRGDK